jgi:hypothetical protein
LRMRDISASGRERDLDLLVLGGSALRIRFR